MLVKRHDGGAGPRRRCGNPDVVGGQRAAPAPQIGEDFPVDVRNRQVYGQYFDDCVAQEFIKLADIVVGA